jgi:hypothetical protein
MYRSWICWMVFWVKYSWFYVDFSIIPIYMCVRVRVQLQVSHLQIHIKATSGKCYKKFCTHKSNHNTYTPYTLNTHIRWNKKNIIIYNNAYPVLKNQNYYMLTSTHRHIHSGKTRRREHGGLLNTTSSYVTVRNLQKNPDLTRGTRRIGDAL